MRRRSISRVKPRLPFVPGSAVFAGMADNGHPGFTSLGALHAIVQGRMPILTYTRCSVCRHAAARVCLCGEPPSWRCEVLREWVQPVGTSLINWKHVRAQALGNEPPEELPPQVKLPMLPHAVTEFSRRADDPNASSRELGSIIESDTGLTCELLKYVNSALFGLRKKAASAQQAISLLGVRQSKLFLLTTGIKVALSSRESKLVNFRAFWAANLERALFAREVAKLLNADADLAFAASMMQDSLLPVISTEMCALYTKYCALDDATAPDLVTFEQQKLGWDHPLATAYIMWAWNFPDDLLCCILFHHDGFALLQDTALADTAAAAVAVASLLPDPLRQVRHGLKQLVQLSERWPQFDLMTIATQVEAHVAALSPGTSVELSLLRRCEKLFAELAETADTSVADSLPADCTA